MTMLYVFQHARVHTFFAASELPLSLALGLRTENLRHSPELITDAQLQRNVLFTDEVY